MIKTQNHVNKLININKLDKTWIMIEGGMIGTTEWRTRFATEELEAKTNYS